MLTYQVKSGDTLSSIARKFYGDARKFPAIASANSIAAPYVISLGQQLSVPDLDGVGPLLAATSTVPASATARLSEQRLARLHPAVATRARAMLELAAHQGAELLVTQGLRTWEEQDTLYAKGRNVAPIGKKYVVTNAKGGQSYHNFGLAFDVMVLDAIGKADWDASHPGWRIAADAGKSVGLEWGGDWSGFKDIPHFQYTAGLTLARCRQLYPSGLQMVWTEVA
jgi:D-alanyl-D-alanine dipeptidase